MLSLTLDVLKGKDPKSIILGTIGGDSEVEGNCRPRSDWTTVRWRSVLIRMQRMIRAGCTHSNSTTSELLSKRRSSTYEIDG